MAAVIGKNVKCYTQNTKSYRNSQKIRISTRGEMKENSNQNPALK